MEEVLATPVARDIIEQLKEKHGELMFYMSGGCCEGSQPMCFEKGEFYTGSSTVLKGNVESCEFYLSEDQNEYYKNSRIILDAQPGMGGGFSLEAPLGVTFTINSELLENPS